jgi:hypothetical protein
MDKTLISKPEILGLLLFEYTLPILQIWQIPVVPYYFTLCQEPMEKENMLALFAMF